MRAQVLIGDIYDAQKDPAKAVAAYEAALALEPNEALERKVETLREGLALAAMPAEFQAIESSTMLSREQLAALVGVRLDGLFKRAPRRNAVVMTDTRGSWAVPWILSVTRVGVMEVYPNHTFQPGAVVRRGDLAEAASRVLSLIAAEKPALASSWRSARRQFADVPPAHLSYPAASVDRRGRRDAAARGRQLPVVEARDRRRGGGGREEARRARRERQTMNLTAANQLTILRMLIIPGFVILLLYGYRGWALVSFFVAGITDLLDGLIARRAGQKTTLGAWLDPMADKLLLVTMFVMLTLPGIGSSNRLPLWFTVLVISRDVAIVLTVAVVNLAVGPRTFRPSIYGKIATATFVCTGVVTLYFNYLERTSDS